MGNEDGGELGEAQATAGRVLLAVKGVSVEIEQVLITLVPRKYLSLFDHVI